jgi:DNA-binding Xre family transcriptional regulator
VTDSKGSGGIRRSAGMLQNPREAHLPSLPAKKPPTPRPQTKQPERVSTSPHPKPKVLMGEVAAPIQKFAASGGGVETGKQRDAFRAFMTARHLRPTEWARAAGVAPGEILGFLTAKTRHIAPETLEKLARAANCAIEDFFR